MTEPRSRSALDEPSNEPNRFRRVLADSGRVLELLFFPLTSLFLPRHRRRLDEANQHLGKYRGYAQGLLRPHYAEIFEPMTACGLLTWRGTCTSQEPTLIGILCLRCRYERRRARRRATQRAASAANSSTSLQA